MEERVTGQDETSAHQPRCSGGIFAPLRTEAPNNLLYKYLHIWCKDQEHLPTQQLTSYGPSAGRTSAYLSSQILGKHSADWDQTKGQATFLFFFATNKLR
jgi:hypothetical protein